MAQPGHEFDIFTAATDPSTATTERAVDAFRRLALGASGLPKPFMYTHDEKGQPLPPFGSAIIVEPCHSRQPKTSSEPDVIPGVAITVDCGGAHAYEGYLVRPNGRPNELLADSSFELAVAGLSYTLGLLRRAATHIMNGDYATWATPARMPFAIDERPTQMYGRLHPSNHMLLNWLWPKED